MPARPPHEPGSVTPESGATEAPGRSLSEILEELAQISHAQQGEASAMRGAVSELSRALARLFEMIRADRASQHTRIAELEEALAHAESRIRELETDGATGLPDAPPSAGDFDALRGAAERPAAPAHDEPFGRPGILRVFPGAVLPSNDPPDLDVESDLIGFDDRELRQAVAQHAVPTLSPPPAEPRTSDLDGAPDRAAEVADGGSSESAASTKPETSTSTNGDRPTVVADLEDDEPSEPTLAPPTIPKPAVTERAAPIPIEPRPARKRKGRLRRRRIDARKLATVDPASALRAMVSSIDNVWTHGDSVDLVVALTDGGTLHIFGGNLDPITVSDVKPGTPARATVTVASAQVVPLFGRLDLTDEQSAPLIHGSRRDADLLVGWIDRAQRLEAQPL
ncbi:MAG: hypothetical protein Q7T55_20400 [Solirubrobacteraceae bacterium]|nr:hypothetical protein [Solirubrobacteraceae bacterium]